MPDQTGCTADSDCLDPAFPRCNTMTGECVPECLVDADCQLPAICNPSTHRCVVPGCVPSECQAGQWCDEFGDGQCKPGCDSDEDCVAPAACNFGTHVCETVVDCCGGTCRTAEGEYCDGLTCTCAQSCVVGDCPFGTCLQAGSSCDPDSGKCVICPSGFACDVPTGRCRCDPMNNHCPTGAHCDPATGECVNDNACNPPCPTGYTCLASFCVPPGFGVEGAPCFRDTDCSFGLLCNSSLFCIQCLELDPSFMADFTCRWECSLLGGSCPGAGQTCNYWHSGFKGLCDPLP
jgi:hypothetical protein